MAATAAAGLVHGYDRKPKRRLFELLKSQDLQANQDVTFLTDGGEEVRALTELVTPEAEHVLDWFHITMRLTVLSQYARGVAHHDEAEGALLLASRDGSVRTHAINDSRSERPLWWLCGPQDIKRNARVAEQAAAAA